MASRTGLPALKKVGSEMCRLIVKFAPVIQLAYPDSPALQAALAAALAACQELEKEITDNLPIGV